MPQLLKYNNHGITACATFGVSIDSTTNRRTEMALRKTGSWTYGNAIATVYRDAENQEYQVQVKVGGGPKVIGTYFTDDRDDAMGTAKCMAQQADTSKG